MKILFSIILLLVIGAAVPKILLKDKVADPNNPSCLKSEAYQFLENPLERILIFFGGLQTLSSKNQSDYIVRAYTIFGIPFAKVEVESCNGSVRRL